jgi:hypothetical protein
MMSRPNVPHANATTVPLERLALVYRTRDGAEQDRADGPMLAALLSGIRPEDRASLFEASDIGTEVRSLADVITAVAEHGDTPSHVTSALYIVEMGLRALIPRIESFENPDKTAADFYTVEIAPEVTP